MPLSGGVSAMLDPYFLPELTSSLVAALVFLECARLLSSCLCLDEKEIKRKMKPKMESVMVVVEDMSEGEKKRKR